MIQRYQHETGELSPLSLSLRGCSGGSKQVERSASAGFVLDELDLRAMSGTLEPPGDLMPAQRAQPGEQRRLPSVGVQLANALDERGLHHVLCRRIVSAKPRTGKPVEPGEIVREELVGCRLIASQDAPCEKDVAHFATVCPSDVRGPLW